MSEATYKLLKNYNPSLYDEQICKNRMLELLDFCENCFSRDCKVGHFTASAFLLNKEKTHVLLMHHRKLNKWLQLGGHCDGDPNIINVSIKEAKEESGIQEIRLLNSNIFDIDIHLVPSSTREEAHYHFDIRFLLHAYGDNKFHKNHESKELKWIAKDSQNIPTQSESVLRMFRKWQDLI